MIRSGALDQVLGRMLDDLTEGNLLQRQHTQYVGSNDTNKNDSPSLLSSPLLSNAHGHNQGIIASLLLTTEGAVIGYATSSLYKELQKDGNGNIVSLDGSNINNVKDNNIEHYKSLYGNLQIKPEVIGGMAAHLWCNNDCVGRELLGEYKGSGCLIMSCNYGKCIIAPIGCGMWNKSGRFDSNEYNGNGKGKAVDNTNNSTHNRNQNGNDSQESNRNKEPSISQNVDEEQMQRKSNSDDRIKIDYGEDERSNIVNINDDNINENNNNVNIENGINLSSSKKREEEINSSSQIDDDDITTSLLCLISLDQYDGLILTKAKAMAAALEEALKQIEH